ncbi:MAG: flagellar biosynthesis anti-sigma factor FlgM [Bacillota bacterium]|jgi:negative regulator of flagellin synthesis FlgM|nr:flagellar biosynthesis anti-sigma factor FlgM [Candidatus Fermentithermobacillaceae bacterium]
MMISRAQIGQILKVYESQAAQRSSKVASARGASAAKDKVVLSASQDDQNRVREILKDIPDIRLEKVEALKKQIEAGTYKVEASEVADKMLGRLLADRIK